MSEGLETQSEKEPAKGSGAHAHKAEEQPFISQKDYRPTPYRTTIWEVVGDVDPERDFVPLEVNILVDESATADPMFEVFEHGFRPEDGAFFHGAGARARKVAGQDVENEAVIPAEQLADIEAQWMARVEEAHATGYAEGAAATEEKIAERYEMLMQRVKGVTDAIYQQWSGLAGKLERQAVDLSLQVARKLVHTTAEAKPEYIVSVIREALKQLGAAKPVRIRVSNDDFEFLSIIGLPMELSEQELGVQYIADENVKSGCIVETDFGEVDLVLDRMWEEVRDRIYEGKS